MPPIPHDVRYESTVALLRDPYRFISRTARKLDTDVFEARILLGKSICITGPGAAELFYDSSRFTRQGATPRRIRKTLFGEGGVQGLDGEERRHRKAMFMSLTTPDRIDALGREVDNSWDRFVRKWSKQNSVVLYEELHELLFRDSCAWAGIPLLEADVPQQTRDVAVLFDQAGAIGRKNWEARRARGRCEKWLSDLVVQIRAGEFDPPEDSAARTIAFHRGLDGELLNPHVAAVELLNVIRPIVAVAVYMTLAAVALHQYPDKRPSLGGDRSQSLEDFVQEVRRFYPFFPMVGAITRREFEWRGYVFPEGSTVLLDLYGINHDPRLWTSPDDFSPERFREWDRSPFNFIPQGGGDHYENHRCPGEWICIDLMKRAVNYLDDGFGYEVPAQDLDIDFTRMPALPHSRFVMTGVHVARTPLARAR